MLHIFFNYAELLQLKEAGFMSHMVNAGGHLFHRARLRAGPIPSQVPLTDAGCGVAILLKKTGIVRRFSSISGGSQQASTHSCNRVRQA